jgi:hypothetical protein
MGRFQAAIKDNTYGSINLPEPGKDLVYSFRARAGQGTPGKEYSRASLGQPVETETAGCPQALVVQKRLMLRIVAETSIYRLTAHLQKESVQVEPFRTDFCAETAKIAFKGA